MEVIEKAIKQGRTTLSEYESKQVLSAYRIPVTREVLVHDRNELTAACREVGYPLVLKGCASVLSHKTEGGLIRLDIRNEEEATASFNELMDKLRGTEGAVLVQEMVKGQRELVAGLIRDAQFGPCVMFGLGGIFTEVLKDTAFRIAPLEKGDALEMMNETRGSGILGAIRGLPEVDKGALAEILVAVGRIGMAHEAVREIDINPIIISGGKPVAVDALVVVDAN